MGLGYWQHKLHPQILQGGILWSLNLTEFPHGALGPIFPLCIAGLHLANVQVRDNTLVHLNLHSMSLLQDAVELILSFKCIYRQGAYPSWR